MPAIDSVVNKPTATDRAWGLVQALQNAGYSHTEIIDALLFEAGWMIEVVASGEATYLASK
jgi:hypothetical protein